MVENASAVIIYLATSTSVSCKVRWTTSHLATFLKSLFTKCIQVNSFLSKRLKFKLIS